MVYPKFTKLEVLTYIDTERSKLIDAFLDNDLPNLSVDSFKLVALTLKEISDYIRNME